MNKNISCPTVPESFDARIASQLGNKNISAMGAAYIRLLYCDNVGISQDAINDENIDEYLPKIASFYKTLTKFEVNRLREAVQHPEKAYKEMSNKLGVDFIMRRVENICSMFSQRLSYYEGLTGKTREQILRGVTVTTKDGKKIVVDAAYIFRNTKAAFNHKFEQALSEWEKDPTSKQKQDLVARWSDFLENYESLQSIAMGNMLSREPLDPAIDYAFINQVNQNADDYLTPDDPKYIDVEEQFNVEESTKEGWQEVNEAIDAYQSLSKKVKMLLASLPARAFSVVQGDNGARGISNTVVDDLGLTVSANPVKVYQHLQFSLRNMQNSNDMMAIIKRIAETYPGYQMLYDKLNSSFQLRTEFYVDLNKTFERFRQHRERNGIQSPQDLNVIIADQAYGMWYSNVVNQNYDKKEYIFRTGNDQKFAEFKKSIAEGLIENKKVGIVTVKTPTYKVFNQKYPKISDKINALNYWFTALGMTVPSNEVVSLVTDKSRREDLFKVLNELRDYYDVIANVGNEILKDKTQQQYIKEIARVALASSVTEEYKSRIRRSKSTFNSFVNPSFLSDFIDNITRIVQKAQEAGDETEAKKELRQYIHNLYLNDPSFNNGNPIFNANTPLESSQILNTWIDEILNSDLTDPRSFAAQLKYYRILGTEDVDFEDFSSAKHRTETIVEYFSYSQRENINYVSKEEWEERVNLAVKGEKIIKGEKKFEPLPNGSTFYVEGERVGYKIKNDKPIVIPRTDYANYPIFVLGDAGVSKSILGRRYTENEILDSMWKTYLGERRKIRMLLAAKENWEKQGRNIKDFVYPYKNAFYNPDTKTYNFDIFSYKNSVLSFLSDESTKVDGAMSEGEFKRVAKAYLNSVAEKNMQNFEKDGVFKFNGERCTKAPINLPSNSTADVKEMMRMFSWNMTHAFIQQFQLMTIDTQFYTGTKDLQKRYKETHAPGTPLDIYRRDEQGNYIFADASGNLNTTETFVYFDDIDVNAENTDNYFMQSVLRYFAKQDVDVVNKAIEEGVCTPKQDATEEAARIAKLKSLLGKNYKYYEVYRKNTLTDGQGYRTIESYRKVMLGAGKWDINGPLERMYRKLLQYRENATRQGWTETEEAKTMLAEIADTAIALQPLKPYLFGFEEYKYGDSGYAMKIPVQHKYAEVVLIPELMRDSKLKTIAQWMETNHVDMIGTTKIAKVGSYGAAKINTTNTPETLNQALDNAVKHTINYGFYKIQTNVPEHVNSSGLFGTQARKIFFKNVIKTKNYSHYLSKLVEEGVEVPTEIMMPNGKTARLSGRNLISFYNALICANLWQSYSQITDRVTNPELLQRDMMYNIIMQARQSKDNLFGVNLTDGEFDLPLCELGWEFETSSLLFSWFKKKVLKQKIKAGSAVQASAMGLTELVEDEEDTGGLQMVYDSEGNPIAAQCELTWDFNYVTSSGETVHLNFSDYCDANGYLLDEEGNSITDLSQVDNSKLNKEFPGILDMISYRIPTENQYSLISLKAVRFTPKSAQGGTIKVPAHFTTIAGFDFDIDKLYFIRKEFKESRPYWKNLKISENDWNRIINYVQENHPNFIREVQEVTEESFSDEQLYDIFGKIYDEEPAIKRDLEKLRPKGAKTPLNRFFEESEVAKAKAKKKGFDNVKDYKQFLVQQAASDLGYTPETIKKVKDGYLAFNKEAIKSAGLSMRQLIREAASALNITVAENENAGVFEKYDFNKRPQDNTRVARNNMILALYQCRLSDPETFRERYVAGGFPESSLSAKKFRVLEFNAKDAIRQYREGNLESLDVDAITALVGRKDFVDPEPNYDACDVDTLFRYNQQNQLAAKLIGIFANQNTNAAFCMIMDSMSLKHEAHEDEKLIRFGSLIGAQAFDLSTNRVDENKELGADVLVQAVLLENGEVRNANMVVEFLAASVDAVKDPVLNYLNLNELTADIAGLLARMGYSTDDIGALLNQPIIKEICEYSKNTGIRDMTSCINAIESSKKYEKLSEHIKQTKTPLNQNPTLGQLMFNIAEYNSLEGDMSEEMKRKQLGVLELFKKCASASSALSKFVQNTKFTAANAVGSSWGDFYEKMQRASSYLENIKDSPLQMSLSSHWASDLFKNDMPLTISDNLLGLDEEEYLMAIQDNPFAFEQLTFDLYRKFAKEVIKYYPYDTDTYKSARGFIASMTRNGYLDADTINLIHRDLPVFLLSRMPNSQFNGEQVYVDNNGNPVTTEDSENPVTNREYFLKVFPEKFATLTYGLRNGTISTDSFNILNYIRASFNANTDLTDLSLNDALGLQQLEVDALKASWASLERDLSNLTQDDLGLNDEDWAAFKDMLPTLANDLFMYSFYKSGLAVGPMSLLNITPYSVKSQVIVSDQPVMINGEAHRLTYTEWYKGIKENGVRVPDAMGLVHDGYAELFDEVQFFEQLCLNHPDSSLVFTPRDRQVNNLSKFFYEGEALRTVVEINRTDRNKDKLKDLVLKVDENTIYFKPVINIGGKLFIVRSNDGEYNETTSGSVTYYQVPTLGVRNGGLTYGHTNSVAPNAKESSLIDRVPEGSAISDDYKGEEEFETASVNELWSEIQLAAKYSGRGMDILTTERPSRKSEMVEYLETSRDYMDEVMKPHNRKIC